MNEPQRHRGHRGKTQRRKSVFLSLCSCLCVLWASVVRSSEYTDPLDMIVPTSAPLADPNVVPAQFPPIPTPDSFPPDRPDLLNRPLGPPPPAPVETPLPEILRPAPILP